MGSIGVQSNWNWKKTYARKLKFRRMIRVINNQYQIMKSRLVSQGGKNTRNQMIPAFKIYIYIFCNRIPFFVVVSFVWCVRRVWRRICSDDRIENHYLSRVCCVPHIYTLKQRFKCFDSTIFTYHAVQYRFVLAN